MIAVIDYGAGNLKSVKNALDHLGAANMRASTAKEILLADAVILPGVGEFGTAMAELERRGIKEAVIEAANGGRPLLGICLGMQLLFEAGEESPGAKGLGILPGRVPRFPAEMGLKIPHMGWNSVMPLKENRLLDGLPKGSYMYFVHSFYVKAAERADVSAISEYGLIFDAAVERGNIFGCQFHPEKSGAAGLVILKNFIEIAKGE
ncbi:imidazole glycerol phosphate synthase subunit HisH [Cloacibacillus evryensis]|mgnify:FL=1|uniref:imidazole glycerol phosphate synthase subunit HisH n=1 Tax=Cloacibacillus evryensis TaxID=508460 RepID=UPI00044B35CE|nr:imidazole glycerol phosphate synthase subunit HisH [Cloacibacillus evryensis]EXG78153.1 imidazole glycerol phosphate synthase, glutamine amidotransferase subunit [Cloacibacillus evryensis DSM 19522]